MKESYFTLSRRDQLDALGVAAAASGRPADLLEKDVWVVAVLNALFSAPFAESITFKGGTSLSKAFQLIGRFSEDVDVTYDIRALLADEKQMNATGTPPNTSQSARWKRKVREHLPRWVADTALPALKENMEHLSVSLVLNAEGSNIVVNYGRLVENAPTYVKPAVLIEFGARSTGEPATVASVRCDAAIHLPDLSFPTASPRTMNPERTFWEKATAAHVYVVGGNMRGERFARHFYDLVKLDRGGIADSAIEDAELAEAVAAHKQFFFVEKNADGVAIKYEQAVRGSLQLIPAGSTVDELSEDYEKMLDAGLLEENAPTFKQILDSCAQLQQKVNSRMANQNQI